MSVLPGGSPALSAPSQGATGGAGVAATDRPAPTVVFQSPVDQGDDLPVGSAPASVNGLDAYVRAKQETAQLLELTKAVLERAQRTNGAEAIRPLLVRLAEDRFNLVVLGAFKRGKSSLVNAIVGRPILPTAVVPLTTVITRLSYGQPEQAIVRLEATSLPSRIRLSEIAAYVTERENPGNRKRVTSVDIQLPAAFLRRGLVFVDTPGIGAADERPAAETYRFLPESDAAIFVTSVEAPLSESELLFLDAVRQHVRKIFFVMNKVDQVDAGDLAEILAFAEQGLRSHVGIPTLTLLPVSARQGLQAAEAMNDAEYAASGLARLEALLGDFLSAERGSAFLVGLLDRALRVVEREREGALAGDCETLAAHLTSLRDRLLDGSAAAVDHEDELPMISALAVSSVAVAAPAREGRVTPEEHDVEADLLQARTCPICAVAWQGVYEFLCSWQYALSIDPAAREAHRADGGFCAFHTWQLASLASPQGLARGFPPLAERAAREVHALSGLPGPAAADRLKELLPDQDACRACRIQSDGERRAARRLLGLLDTPEGGVGLRRGPGLCLRHLHQLLPFASERVAGVLTDQQSDRLQQSSDAMRSFSLKIEARRRDLVIKEEESSGERTLALLAGERTIR